MNLRPSQPFTKFPAVPGFPAATLSVLAFFPLALEAGPYPGAAGIPGSDAISKDDPAIVNWATGHRDITYGTDVDEVWRNPSEAIGPAEGNSFNIVALGNGGRITMFFPHPISDGPGPDFAVFENAFSDTFLELAFVEVSSNGDDWFRFPNDSQTAFPVGGFGTVDPTNLLGLAGKYRQGFGTPFDLADLPADPALDKSRVVFVRVIDIVGDGYTTDTGGDPIYDPTPTIGSGGFDLDAIAVLHQNDGPFSVLQHGFENGNFVLKWQSNPANGYRVETTTRLDGWQPADTLDADPLHGVTRWTTPSPSDPERFWRIVRVAHGGS